MRKTDKKLNFKKVNLLTEKRYLDSKGLLNESFHEPDGTPIGVDSMHRPVTEYGQSNQYDLRQDENMDTLVSMILSYLGKEKTNNAAIANDNKVIVYNELLQKLMQMSPASNLNNGENGNEVYTNNPEAMAAYLNKNGVSNFTLIDSNNRPYPTAGDDTELNEDGLGDYSSELRSTGDYPWTTFLGDKQRGEDENMRNKQASEKFKAEFNNAYKGEAIETTNGRYFFETLKYTNNFGKYDLIFTKPKSEGDWSDKMLWIKYDQSNGYYIDSNDDIELLDKDSVDKVINMLDYNK
jgi:hypothetical protein